jgi:hypothetical protein
MKRSFALFPEPEPGSIVTMLGGVAILALLGRKRLWSLHCPVRRAGSRL